MGEARLVLGLNVSHDRSAFLARDGRLLCGVAEERLDRRKHSVAVNADGEYLATLPTRAIDYVLAAAGATLADCDEVVAVGSVVYHPQRPLRNLTAADVLRQLPPTVDPARVSVLPHHFAHAVAAYAASPFDDAAVMTIDGAGNVVAQREGWLQIPAVEHATFYHATGPRLRELRQVVSAPRALNSLGAMYELVTLFAGFGKFQEGKTMGLAPYGSPALLNAWKRAVAFDGPLSYRIDPAFQTFDWRGRQIPRAFVRRFGPPRHHSEELRPVDRDLAFAAQRTLEEALVRLARELRTATGARNLALAGGVFLNSVANQRIAVETGFERVFIVPCAADDGTALGAALWPHLRDGGDKAWSMTHAGWGRSYDDWEIERALREQADALEWSQPADVCERTAARLADGAIVGWLQGGAEVGPRALGQRSILADPRRAAMKDALNDRVKYREAFRPFAPSVLAERASDYFELEGDSPFMLRVAAVKRPDEIPAVTHVDGTGRVQTVTSANGRFRELLQAFERVTGVPALLNTSFNLAGEPIVETPADAIHCFLNSDIDLLVLGGYLVEKRNPQLCRRLARQRRELQLARQQAAAQELELESIRQSRGWRLLNALNRWRR
jgi:carbamoyltransferase